MAKKEPARVTNLSETKDVVRNAVPKIVNLKERRSAINKEIASIRANVEAAGVPKNALDHAIRVKEMDPLVRERFDEGYAIARDAVGLRMSASLFDMIETPVDAPAVQPAAEPKGAIGEELARRGHFDQPADQAA
jgi:uncharacterized protein (UPF0335 family)